VRRVGRDELARDPVGCYVAGETFAHFCASPRLWGIVLWGRPSAAFAAADRYIRAHRAMLERWVEALALIRPPGMGGALVAGAFEVLPRPYAVGVVEDAAAAVAWLAAAGHGELGAADVPGLLTDLHAEASSTPQVVGALRAFLDTHLVDVELPAAAVALGTSERTLQRKLAEASTSFTDELADARIRAARRLLADTDAALTAIAHEVGCASLQHFGAMFRRKTGESPSAFRTRHRPR
jgi:AraC-like DNA-binding protein